MKYSNNMKLSFIVPVYNVEKYLDQCLQSLYDQSLLESDFEILIVNDGSLDNSLLIAERFLEQHTNIRIYTQKNRGLSSARNWGILNAKGDYIIFVDSDDYLLPNTISSLLNKAIQNELELVRGEYCHCNEEGDLMPARSIEKEKILYADTIVDGEVLYRHIFGKAFFSPLLLIKRTLLISNNLYFEEGMYFEDIIFALRLSFVVKRVMYHPITFYVYRLREGSITFSMNEKKLNDLVSIILKIRNYSQSVGLFPETRLVMESNLTNLCVYFLLRLTEFDFAKRKQITLPLLQNHILPLLVVGDTKEKLVSSGFNMLGNNIFYLLYPVVKMKSIIRKLF